MAGGALVSSPGPTYLYVMFFGRPEQPGLDRAEARDPPNGVIAVVATLEDARRHIPEGVCNVGQFSNEDPTIREVWL